MRICLVCMGNICRSPIAAAVLEHKLSEAGLDDVHVESAGVGGWHIGDPADARALRVLDENGYDGSRHRAQQFRSDWFQRFDLVLALDRHNLEDLRDMSAGRYDDKIKLLRSYDPLAVDGDDLDVPDPYYGGSEGFDQVLKLTEDATDGLVSELARSGDG